MVEMATLLEWARNTYSEHENVTAIDVGREYAGPARLRTDRICVRVHVERRLEPGELSRDQLITGPSDEVHVDVIEQVYRTRNTAVRPPPGRSGWAAEVAPGIGVHRDGGWPGTLGCLVRSRDDGSQRLLGCAHVFGHPGSDIFVEGDWSRRIGRVESSILGPEGDAAMASVAPRVRFDEVQLGLGFRPGRAARAVIGQRITKSGRTTGVTGGEVDGIGYYKVDYREMGGEVVWVEGFKVVPYDASNPTNVELSAPGDSGALWCSLDGRSAVGLNFAGERDGAPESEYALACHFGPVLQRFGVTLENAGGLRDIA